MTNLIPIPNSESVFLYVLPLLYIAILVEGYFSKKNKLRNYSELGVIQNFNITFGQMLLHYCFFSFFKKVYLYIYPIHLPKEGIPLFQLVILFIFVDLIHYFFHRLNHRVNFLWGMHLVHHSSHEYNLTTSGRTPWLKSFFLLPLYVPFAFFQVSLDLLMFVVLITHLLQFWVHTEFVRQRRWLDFVIVNPSFHRVHHGTQRDYLDKNYAEVLPLWDHLFGTYESEKVKPVYGLTQSIDFHRPVIHHVYYYVYLYKLFKASRLPFSERIKIWFKPPEWKLRDLSPTLIRELHEQTSSLSCVSTSPLTSGTRSKTWQYFALIYLLTGVFLVFQNQFSSLLLGLVLTLVLILMELQGIWIMKSISNGGKSL